MASPELNNPIKPSLFCSPRFGFDARPLQVGFLFEPKRFSSTATAVYNPELRSYYYFQEGGMKLGVGLGVGSYLAASRQAASVLGSAQLRFDDKGGRFMAVMLDLNLIVGGGYLKEAHSVEALAAPGKFENVLWQGAYHFVEANVGGTFQLTIIKFYAALGVMTEWWPQQPQPSSLSDGTEVNRARTVIYPTVKVGLGGGCLVKLKKKCVM